MRGIVRNAKRAVLPSLGLLVLLTACGSPEDRAGLVRCPVSPAPQNGWVRLPLDGESQRGMPDLWLGDARGRSVPFLVEREGLWEPRRLELERVLMGRDGAGRPTVEFSLKFPQGWQVREREQLHLDLDLEGQGSWVCPLRVERRGDGGSPISLERELPLQVFHLEGSESSHGLSIPWDARSYRITLQSAYGKAPSIRGLTVTARTEPDRLSGQWVVPRLERKPSAPGEVWAVKLEAPERVVGLELQMEAPLAPIHPEVSLPPRPQRGLEIPEPDHNRRTFSEGLVWNLPALETRSSRVSIAPVLTSELELGFPAGAHLEAVKVLVRRETLLFPAEAGATYYLHLGGGVLKAPGDLGALPDSSRALYQRVPLTLGPGEPDPQGLPRRVASVDQAAERSRPWLPWITGIIVAVLAVVGFRLLKR